MVEVAQEVVDLVAPHLLADDRAARRKLRVVRADLFEYLRGLDAQQKFDHAFYDIWRSDSESTFFRVVVPLLRLSRGHVRSVPICWNESVMRGQLRFSLHDRWDQLKLGARGGAPTLDALCEDGGSFWIAWSVPFFRWARAAVPNAARFDEMAGLYAGAYGRPSFPDTWRLVASQDRVCDLAGTSIVHRAPMRGMYEARSGAPQRREGENVKMKPLSWTPVARGPIFCASACGRGCTKAEHETAVRKGVALARRLGAGWTWNVRENLGWLWYATSPCGRITVRQDNPRSFSAYVADGRWYGRGCTPRLAVLDAIRSVTATLVAVGAASKGLEAVKRSMERRGR